MQVICVATRAIVDSQGMPFNLAAAKILMERVNRSIKEALAAGDRKAVAKAKRERSRLAVKAATLQS